MHGEEVGAFQNPTVVIAYLSVAGLLALCSKFAVVGQSPVEALHEHDHHLDDTGTGVPEAEMAPAK